MPTCPRAPGVKGSSFQPSPPRPLLAQPLTHHRVPSVKAEHRDLVWRQRTGAHVLPHAGSCPDHRTFTLGIPMPFVQKPLSFPLTWERSEQQRAGKRLDLQTSTIA